MRTERLLFLFLSAWLLVSPGLARAHIGSKDVFEQLSAGPYKLFVTVRPPAVVPGIAVVEVRTMGPEVRTLRVATVPLTGEASSHPQSTEPLRRAAANPAYFTGSVWLRATGSWQIRFQAEGAGGMAVASVPVAALAGSALHLQHSLGLSLVLVGLTLALGMSGILLTAMRGARPAPGELSPALRSRRALVAGGAVIVTVLMAVWFGNRLWSVEAAGYAAGAFHPLTLHPVLTGATLELKIDAGLPDDRGQRRSNQDFLLDHGHIMHLYAVRWPEMDAAYHLHPAQVAPGEMRSTLPVMVPGNYHLFGDVVHSNGLPETLTATLVVPPNASTATLDAEDAAATPAPLSQGDLGTRYRLPDGYTMVWDRPATLTANTAELFRFKLYDAHGELATDVYPYLGMAGHAAFLKTDGTVFAHTHPDGSAAMPAMMLANASDGPMAAMPMDSASDPAASGAGQGASKHPEPLDPIVEFPYGFPTGGRYRIFVQMKHGSTVETGVFDAEVKPAA